MEILLVPASRRLCNFPSSQLRTLEASANTLNKCSFLFLFVTVTFCWWLVVNKAVTFGTTCIYTNGEWRDISKNTEVCVCYEMNNNNGLMAKTHFRKM
jgi:hypothetical protein